MTGLQWHRSTDLAVSATQRRAHRQMRYAKSGIADPIVLAQRQNEQIKLPLSSAFWERRPKWVSQNKFNNGSSTCPDFPNRHAGESLSLLVMTADTKHQ